MTDALQAVIFDMDGTLTDSEEWWDQVRRQMAADAGIEWPATATTDMMGMSTPEWSQYLAETVGIPGTPKELAERTIDAMVERYRGGLPLLTGAHDAMARMAEVYPVGIASSSPRRLIEAVRDAAGWSDLVDAVVSTEEVERGKPAPDGFLACALALEADPRYVAVIEDSTNGVKSALAAGMITIAVPPAFHPPADELLESCDAVIDDLNGLTLDLVQSLAAARAADDDESI